MALNSRLARRPDTQYPARWTPPGTTVVQRYRSTLGEREGDDAWCRCTRPPRSSPTTPGSARSGPPAPSTRKEIPG